MYTSQFAPTHPMSTAAMSGTLGAAASAPRRPPTSGAARGSRLGTLARRLGLSLAAAAGAGAHASSATAGPRPGRDCSPRHRMQLHSRNEGANALDDDDLACNMCLSLLPLYDCPRARQRREHASVGTGETREWNTGNCVGDVAGTICQALEGGERRHPAAVRLARLTQVSQLAAVSSRTAPTPSPNRVPLVKLSFHAGAVPALVHSQHWYTCGARREGGPGSPLHGALRATRAAVSHARKLPPHMSPLASHLHTFCLLASHRLALLLLVCAWSTWYRHPLSHQHQHLPPSRAPLCAPLQSPGGLVPARARPAVRRPRSVGPHQLPPLRADPRAARCHCRVVQVDSFKTRVETAHGFSA